MVSYISDEGHFDEYSNQPRVLPGSPKHWLGQEDLLPKLAGRECKLDHNPCSGGMLT